MQEAQEHLLGVIEHSLSRNNDRMSFLQASITEKKTQITQIEKTLAQNASIINHCQQVMQEAVRAKLAYTTEGAVVRLGSLELSDVRLNIKSFSAASKFHAALGNDECDFNFLVLVYRRELHLTDGSIGDYASMRQLLFDYLFDQDWYELNLRYGGNKRE